MTEHEDGPGGLTAARDTLYSVAPEDFVQLRSELAATARESGDRLLSTAIGALRKPTSAAAAVNRAVSADPATADRLVDMGDRLRSAQGGSDAIDRELLRELSVERRALVQDVSARTLDAFAPRAGAAVRDEVTATFDAAVADPDVAARLGRLTHAEQWSGFGAVSDSPALTVVRGGKATTKRPPPEPARGPRKPAGRARSARELTAAEQALSLAESELSTALDREQAAKDRAAALEQRIMDLQSELTAAERDAKDARAAVRSARSRHREATSARARLARRGS